MSSAVAGAAIVAGAAAVVDGAGTDTGGLGGSSDDWVGVVRPDITHHTANPSAAMAITLSKSTSIGGPSTTLSTQPDIATKVPKKIAHCAAPSEERYHRRGLETNRNSPVVRDWVRHYESALNPCTTTIKVGF